MGNTLPNTKVWPGFFVSETGPPAAHARGQADVAILVGKQRWVGAEMGHFRDVCVCVCNYSKCFQNHNQ